jgi:hypothetical protein
MRYLVCLLTLLTSCKDPSLSIFKEFVRVENLPSYKVGTPDPQLCCPDLGEKLHISWQLNGPPPAYLKVSLKLQAGSYEEFWVTLEEKSGVYVYLLLNSDYLETGGILAYRAELFEKGCLVKEWRHQLWVDPQIY